MQVTDLTPARFSALSEGTRQKAQALKERKIRVAEDRKFQDRLRYDQSRFWDWNWGPQDPARSGCGCATRAVEEDTGQGISRRSPSAGGAL
jgi:hypothetical protein